MANVGEIGGPAVDTPEPKQTATPPSNFKGSSSSAPNNPSSVCFQRSSSLRLSQMNNSVNFSSLPCIFASPRVSSPKLSRYLARHHSWDLLDTENETDPYSENLLNLAGANETEQSDTESSGIDTSDILLLDSPIEMITGDPNPVPSSDVHCQNEGELPNLHSNSRRRCLVFETTGSPPRHIGDTYPDFITKEESADKQLNPEKPKSGPSSSRSCLVSGIGLHLNSLVRIREDSNNAIVDYVEKEEAEEEKLGQTTPKKKRRRLENCEENDGCKRCSCKKSKCLKLYCECFSAGLYCIDSCFCQECFNKPIHEDMVVETRKKIEGRNPLAFAPKVVNVPEAGDDSRHKSGCNCRKSNCLKKYCECYQSGVGCSNNCRCDGCKNPLGRKDGSEDKEARMIENGTILQNNEQDNQDSEFCPAPFGAVSCDETETSEQTALAIKRPDGMSNLSVIPECSYNAEKKVGKENMKPEIVRVDYSPRRVMIISCSPNSKRVSSPYNGGGGGGGSSPSSSRSRRKIVLQSSPSFPTPTPKWK